MERFNARRRGAKQSFEDKRIPKCNPPRRAGFGNEGNRKRRASWRDNAAAAAMEVV
jgi:hypothetical protein